MIKPKAFKKTNNTKKIRACKKGTAAEAIGKIEKYTDTFVLTYGQFSLIDALMAILDQTGPAHVVISTWTAAHADLTRSAELLETAEILSMRMIIDRSFHTRQPEYYQHMISLFGINSIRAINTHAKFLVIHNNNWNIVARTSMNLNGNPRLENIEISEHEEFAKFFIDISNEVFSEVSPGEMKSDQLSLSGIADSSRFKPITAKPIKRKTVMEASFTHELTEQD